MIGLIIVLIVLLVLLVIGFACYKSDVQKTPSTCNSGGKKIRLKPEVSLSEIPVSDPTSTDLAEVAAYLKSEGYYPQQVKKIINDIKTASVDAGLVLVRYKNLYQPSKESIDEDMLEY